MQFYNLKKADEDHKTGLKGGLCVIKDVKISDDFIDDFNVVITGADGVKRTQPVKEW